MLLLGGGVFHSYSMLVLQWPPVGNVTNQPKDSVLCYALLCLYSVYRGFKSKWNNKLDKISPCATT